MSPPTPPNAAPPEPAPGRWHRSFAWLIPISDVGTVVAVLRRQLDDLRYQFEHREGTTMSVAEHEQHRAIILDDLVGYPETARIATVAVACCVVVPITCGVIALVQQSWHWGVVALFFAWAWLFYSVRHFRAFLAKRGLSAPQRVCVVERLFADGAITESEANRLQKRLARNERKLRNAERPGDHGEEGPASANREA